MSQAQDRQTRGDRRQEVRTVRRSPGGQCPPDAAADQHLGDRVKTASSSMFATPPACGRPPSTAATAATAWQPPQSCPGAPPRGAAPAPASWWLCNHPLPFRTSHRPHRPATRIRPPHPGYRYPPRVPTPPPSAGAAGRAAQAGMARGGTDRGGEAGLSAVAARVGGGRPGETHPKGPNRSGSGCLPLGVLLVPPRTEPGRGCRRPLRCCSSTCSPAPTRAFPRPCG